MQLCRALCIASQAQFCLHFRADNDRSISRLNELDDTRRKLRQVSTPNRLSGIYAFRLRMSNN